MLSLWSLLCINKWPGQSGSNEYNTQLCEDDKIGHAFHIVAAAVRWKVQEDQERKDEQAAAWGAGINIGVWK